MMNKTLKSIKPNPNLWHVTAEFKGFRFYLNSYHSCFKAEKIALFYKAMFPESSFFVTDRDCCINGLLDDFKRTYTP